MRLQNFIHHYSLGFCARQHSVQGRNSREGSETYEREVEEKGRKLSITDGGQEGKSKVTVSCGFLEK